MTILHFGFPIIKKKKEKKCHLLYKKWWGDKNNIYQEENFKCEKPTIQNIYKVYEKKKKNWKQRTTVDKSTYLFKTYLLLMRFFLYIILK